MEQHEADNLHIIHLNKVIDELRKRIHELETHNYHQWQTMFAFGKEYTFTKKEESQWCETEWRPESVALNVGGT